MGINQLIINPEFEMYPFPEENFSNEGAINLAHYTSISTFFKIMRGKRLKFNRIDRVNDLTEKTLLGAEGEYRRVFVSCFSQNLQESIPMWKMYTPKDNGVMIKFVPLKGKTFKDLFFTNLAYTGNETISLNYSFDNGATQKEIYADFNVFNIIYEEKVTHPTLMNVQNLNQIYKIPPYYAISKDKAWKYEKELRFRLLLKARQAKETRVDDYFSLFLDINFDSFKQIEIIFSPMVDKADWEDIFEDFRKRVEIKTKFIYKNSKFFGKISL